MSIVYFVRRIKGFAFNNVIATRVKCAVSSVMTADFSLKRDNYALFCRFGCLLPLSCSA